MRRRDFLGVSAGLAATAAAGGLLWAPSVQARPRPTAHDAYFSKLNDLLKRAGPGRPVMLVDTARMNRNIDRLSSSVGGGKQYRIVVKSLPSVPLLDEVRRRAKTEAMMVFHQPFLNAVAQAFPNSDVLLGKPMPLAAVETFYRTLGPAKFDPETQVQWLIDSPERLLQYQALARSLGVKMRVNFEIDVGLHRGGLAKPEVLSSALAVVASDPKHLSVSGLMGYEPHLTGMKADLSHPEVQKVLSRFHGFIDRLRAADLDPGKLTLNGAGSHTLKIYEKDRTFNDLSAGSGVVMPTDFDTHHLAGHEPALFIAAPILKRYQKNPFLEDAPAAMAQIYYLYGGYWKAKMASPRVVGEPIYRSTNQTPISASADIDLEVDDYMFLRPTQSEAVMLQFGDLLPVTDGDIAGRWPVFHQTG